MSHADTTGPGGPTAEAVQQAPAERGLVSPAAGARDGRVGMRGSAVPEVTAGGLRPGEGDAPARVIAFDVLGTPAPKGSARAFYKAGMKRAVIVKDNSDRQKSWDAAVRDAASSAVGALTSPPFVDTPLEVTIVFRMARPAGHWGKGRNAGKLAPRAPRAPRGKPDIDKLARATLDALTGIVFDDDARIVDLMLRKEYALPGREGAWIGVTPIVEDRGA